MIYSIMKIDIKKFEKILVSGPDGREAYNQSVKATLKFLEENGCEFNIK